MNHPETRKQRTLQVRVSDDMYDRVLAAAEVERRSVSDWCRVVLDDHAQGVLERVAAGRAAPGSSASGELVEEGKEGRSFASVPARGSGSTPSDALPSSTSTRGALAGDEQKVSGTEVDRAEGRKPDSQTRDAGRTSSSSPASAPFARNCRNETYHEPGRTCRFCLGDH